MKTSTRALSHVSLCTLAFIVVPATAAPPTFTKDVAPILFRHCLRCHRAGDIATNVSFSSYDATRPWAKAIKEKVLRHEMPPWPADPNASVKFRNDRRLSQAEIDTLVAWVNSGAAKGKDIDLPPKPTFAHGWEHPEGLEPDLVIAMPQQFDVPAWGSIPYVRYLVRVPLSEDRWVAALQVLPENPAVVHHMAITEITLDKGVRPEDLNALALIARQQGFQNFLPGSHPAVTAPGNAIAVDMLGVYTPGTTLETYPGDSAKLIKGGDGAYINFNIHYQTIGRAARDRSRIGLWFRSTPPKHQLFRIPGATKTILVNGAEILSDARGRKAEGTGAVIPPIPPYEASYEVTGITAYTEPIVIYQFQPHAHVRCKDFKYTVVYPDGRDQVVLSVPKYDFSWQLAYDLETPLQLPSGSKLIVTAHYDNSVNNKSNPAPDQPVYFRDAENQSLDEMFTPFIQYSSSSRDSARESDVAAGLQSDVELAEVDGCLVSSSGSWMLTKASGPIATGDQAASSIELKAAASRAPGGEVFHLLGVDFFGPARHSGQRVAVKGAWTKGTSSVNVTSLQPLGLACHN